MSMKIVEIYAYREPAWAQAELTGFKVEARDGDIGKVDQATKETGTASLVVDTGPWIFGKKVMLPASVVSNIDFDTETVFVNRTKDEIKNAPEYDEDRYEDRADS
jgi:hypothetical protein